MYNYYCYTLLEIKIYMYHNKHYSYILFNKICDENIFYYMGSTCSLHEIILNNIINYSKILKVYHNILSIYFCLIKHIIEIIIIIRYILIHVLFSIKYKL